MQENSKATTSIYKKNIITFFLNGKVDIFGGMMLAVLPGNEHCIKVGMNVIPLKKVDDKTVYLKNDKFHVPFSFQKKDGRFFLHRLENEGFGLLRFISTSENKAVLIPNEGLHVLAQNMSYHQDILYLFKTNEECKFQYSTSEIISDNGKLTGVREKKYEDNIILSSENGFMLERRVVV